MDASATRSGPNSDRVDSTLVSVIVPTYNYGHVISQALESIRSQTYGNWECVVIDDGSTDDTKEVVASYAKQDPRFRFVRQENQRQAAARNTGLKNSGGNYVQFLDADDLIEPGKLELQVAYLEQHPEVDIVYSGARYFTSENMNERLRARPHSMWKDGDAWMTGVSGKGSDILPKLLRNNIMPINSSLFRRSVTLSVGPFEVTLKAVEDWFYLLKCAANGFTFQYYDSEGARALVRIHQSSWSVDERRVLRATAHMRKLIAELPVDRDMHRLNRSLLAETHGLLGIEEVVNGRLGRGLYQLCKAALKDTRTRNRFKWLICAASAPFVSRDRLRQMVTSSLTRRWGNRWSLKSGS
jgi:glycosyltransferase involved in cell wall biosynthesis